MASPNSKTHSFTAMLESTGKGDTAYVSFPGNIKEIFGTNGQVKVYATFNDLPYRGVLAPMGSGCHIIGVLKSLRQKMGKNAGDVINVTITLDTAERLVEIPDDLARLLSKDRKARVFYESLSFTNRKEYATWITSAGKPETRGRRLKLAHEKLLGGKRNPSEK